MPVVAIYERIKDDGRWREVPVQMPRLSKKDGSLFQKDDRRGRFIISWYEQRKKQRQTVKTRTRNSRELPYLSDALALAASKKWYLDSREDHPVVDPTTAKARPEIHQSVDLYLEAKSGCAKTLSAHTCALHEFREFCTDERITHVDEITKAHIHRFYEQLVRDGNAPFTAANKILKVNSFYKSVLQRDAGHGVIKKADFKRELTVSKVPTRYTKAELDGLFAHMRQLDHLIFSTFLEAGLRKMELMHLEDTDLLHDEISPGVFKCEIRVESKPHWKYQTKTGATRNVLVSKELMDRLLARKDTRRPSKLLFGAHTGKVDHHILERLKTAAKRAKIDPTTVDLHKFRATAATTWLRLKELGGKGWDIGFVRQQLGHADLASIEHYIALVRSDELAMREQKDGVKMLGGPGGLIYSVE
jgi:integrase